VNPIRARSTRPFRRKLEDRILIFQAPADCGVRVSRPTVPVAVAVRPKSSPLVQAGKKDKGGSLGRSLAVPGPDRHRAPGLVRARLSPYLPRCDSHPTPRPMRRGPATDRSQQAAWSEITNGIPRVVVRHRIDFRSFSADTCYSAPRHGALRSAPFPPTSRSCETRSPPDFPARTEPLASCAPRSGDPGVFK
jgi:hypothetical protein